MGVAQRAKAFGMKVIALQRPGRSPESQARITDLGIDLMGSLPELAAAVDILSLHIPAGPSTAGIVDRETIEAMRPGAVLINTSRADVVDAEALLAALDAGRIRAGLDVFPDEPRAAQRTGRPRCRPTPRSSELTTSGRRPNRLSSPWPKESSTSLPVSLQAHPSMS